MGLSFNGLTLRHVIGGAVFTALLGVAVGTLAQPVAVPTMVVQAKSTGVSYELDGVVQAVQQSTLSAQASGRVAVLHVKAGDHVRAGQLLATIDDREAVVGAQKSQAQMLQADAEFRNAHANLERIRDLQSKGFVSKAALDTADTQYKSAVGARDQALANTKQSSISQGFTRVAAPYDGWVLQTHVQAGDLAMPGAPLVTVYAPQPLRAVVQVPSSRAQAVRSAVQTTVRLDETQAPQWITPINRTVVPSADPVSQTTEWRMDLPATESANWVPGQQVRVRFTQDQVAAGARLVVPSTAIVRRGELTVVYLAHAKGFSMRAIRVGASHGAAVVEVLAGLVAGDVVALDAVRAGLANAVPQSSGK